MTDSKLDTRPRAPETVHPRRMDELATLPVFFKLAGRRVVMIGGTEPAAWKAELIAAAGAAIDVFAPGVSHEMEAVAEASDGRITLHRQAWTPDDLTGAALAVAAIDNDADAQIFADAAARAGVPANVVDRPEFCAFQFGAIVNRSPLVVAISTDGAAPVFGQALRSRIEALLPQGFKHWAEAARVWRKAGERLGATMRARRHFWERFTDLAIAEAARQPTGADFETLLAGVVDSDETGVPSGARGFVSLVGAGPGDPELLTLRAVRALRSADVVLYDDLVTLGVLDFARREARRTLVGKTGYGPACKQTEINALMVSLAQQGNRVVRLKSGDPMIFGRGGEEIDELSANGIDFEVVPGISAMQGAAAALKVSLTHRDHARRLQLVTGHSRDGRLPDNLDWSALADPRATTVVYMAHRTLGELRDRLIAAGLSPDIPAYAMINVSRPDAEVVRATVFDLPDALQAAGVNGPCLVVIGEVLRADHAAHANRVAAATTA